MIRLAQDRALQQDSDTVGELIKARLRDEQRQRGDFVRVQACPDSSSEVPDERDARLVILGPECPHARGETNSPAMKQVNLMLDQRDAGPRRYRNSLVFLTPDRTRLGELEPPATHFGCLSVLLPQSANRYRLAGLVH